MIQLYQKITQLSVLELFIKNPYERYYLREASRILDISPMTVKRAFDLLVQERLLVREEFKNQILFRANMNSAAFKHLKTAYNLAWLEEKGIVSMTVLEVQGRGRQKGVCLQWRAGEYFVEFLPKLRLDMVVSDDKVETAIEAITAVAKTGKNGDGKIFVYPVEEVVRVSTGERGKEAI